MIKALKWLCMLLCITTITYGIVAQNNKKNSNAKNAKTKNKQTNKQTVEAAKDEVAKPEEKTIEEKTEAGAKEEQDVQQETPAEESEKVAETQDAPAVEQPPVEQPLAEEPADEQEPELIEQEPVEEEMVPEEPLEDDAAAFDDQEEFVQEDNLQEEPDQEEFETETVEAEEKIEEPEPEPVELGPDEIMGIDTVDLEDPQGNWLYKRVWWERAERKYEKIRIAVNSVLEIRTRFFAKRAELDKTVLDPFYIKIGLSQGELQELIAELIAKLETEIKDKEDVELLEKLESDKQELEQLQKEVQEVIKQDEEVETAIMVLVDQANKMRNYEQQAWQDFKNIARVLDDKKARELFYRVDSAWRNIQELRQYVQTNFSTGFDALVERVKQKVQRVDSAVQALKERGVDLKQRIAEEEISEDEQVEEEPSQGMFARFITTPITNLFSALWDVVMWPIRKLMGTGDVSQEEEIVEQEVIEEQQPPSIATPPDIVMPAPLDSPEEREMVEEVLSAPEDEDDQMELQEEVDVQEPAGGEDVSDEIIDIGEFEEPMMDELDMSMEELEEE